MNISRGDAGVAGFHRLEPNAVLGLAERQLERDFSNLFRGYNSYINRVFELEDMQGNGVVVKFYRPGRWSKEAILDEHRFLCDLNHNDIKVIAPLLQKNEITLDEWEGVPFAFFPKCGGRTLDEFTYDQWEELGRLVGRIHAIGATREARSRQILVPTRSTACHVDYLKVHGLVVPELAARFFKEASALTEMISPLFEQIKPQRIHGDLHQANIIYRPEESFFLIDFDDMVMGPAVQDLWMLLPDSVENCGLELESFLEGYSTFNRFDRRELRLIEALRAMRYLHYLAWCGYQMVEDGGTEVIPDYGSFTFWQREIGELADQRAKIAEEGA